MSTIKNKYTDLLPLLVDLWRHLPRTRQQQFKWLGLLVIVNAFAEVISLGAVLPFIAVLVSPDLLLKHAAIKSVVEASGIHTTSALILSLTIAFCVLTLLVGAVRLLVLWASTRLCFAAGVDISHDMYKRTLYQPYGVHVARNSSEVISGITAKASTVMIGVLMPVITIMSSAVVLIAVVVTLFVIDPIIATLSALGFGVSYGFITLVSRYQLQQNSERIAIEQTALFKALQEGLGGIRDVLLDGSQSLYCDVYHRADKALRTAQSSNTFISASPRYGMEALGTILLAALAYMMSLRSGGIQAALPILGALAFGAQRLIPALQNGYAAWSSVAGNKSSLADTLKLLNQPLLPEAMPTSEPALPFTSRIQFDSVHFRYGEELDFVINGLSLEISKGTRVGFVGSTGSGKSTAIDLLMGLLEPSKGALLVDHVPVVGRKIKAWQKNIAHVPQSVYLADATIAENIAFGVARADIDMKRVMEAAARAQIADFIESGPGGYEAMVGERGIRLSGGQRQRIGIARALYKRASVLVFDEATSALDSMTELAVMKAIEALDRNLTIIMIAHRLTTVKFCDCIFQMKDGRIVAKGTYDELMRNSSSFRELASHGVG